MSKRFFTVVDTFWFSKGFLVVASDVHDELPEYRSGDELLFKRPDGSEITGKTFNMSVELEQEEMPVPSKYDKYKPTISFTVEGLTKEDLPRGSEAWLIVEHSADDPYPSRDLDEFASHGG